MPELVTIPRVPLIETGIDWPASTGPVTFTEGHLRSAAEAPYADQAIKLPRMRFGHTSATTSASESADHHFEQPCVGKFINLRVEDDGNTLYGDLVGVPKWLGEKTKNEDGSEGPSVLSIAYPSRSVEAFFGVSTNTGKTHEMIITSVALLGENLPGVQTLDDLEILFSDEPTEWIEALTADAKVAASQPQPGGDPIPQQRVAASVDTGDVRSAFYEQVATEESGRYWWWLHQMYLDPTVVIAEDDNMEYWLVPYSATASGVEFAEPVQVFIQWVEKETNKVAAKVSLPEQFGQPSQVWASAEESRPEGRSTTSEGDEAEMAIDTASLRTALGLSETDLPDDATEEQINEAIAAHAANAGSGEGDGGTEDEATGDEQPEAVAAAAGSGPRTVAVDAEVWEETRRGAQAGLELQRSQARAANESFLDTAIRQGRIAPSSRASYLAQMNGPDDSGNGPARASVMDLINGLEAGVIPVDEKGHGEGETTKASQGTGLFPELERQRAAAAQEA